jgi:signal transduction histidine kinase
MELRQVHRLSGVWPLPFAPKQRLERELTDINALVQGMDELLQSTIGSKVEIESHLVTDPWPVLADRHQIALAILNLALNARDAMPCGGFLTIETANIGAGHPEAPKTLPVGDYVMLAVRDMGEGMTEDVLARVFEPCFTTKDVVGGSGLGLRMVLGTAQQHGGDAEIDSRPGSGSVVRIYLPRAAPAIVADLSRDAQG